MKSIRFAVAVAALSISASASAMPRQVPEIYYDMRSFLTAIWAEHVPCGRGPWSC